MQSRREFCRLTAGAVAGSLVGSAVTIPQTVASTFEPSTPPAPQAGSALTYREDRPLLELQQAYLDQRFGMFIHYNMATYQDREWGDPTGPAEAFNPTALDTNQWAQAALSANMRFGFLTTKHHDGFPIWPTKTPVAKASVDVVKAYTDSFRKAGLGVGLYYSILDLRNDIRHFNITPEKINLIRTQLTELLTWYGPIDYLIFDGWHAPWSRIPYTELAFDEIYALVKSIQPNCLVSDLNASEYPEAGLYYGDIKAFEQNAGQHLPGGNHLPAQSCVTLTDGWFWKRSDENARLKSAHQVVNEWLKPQNENHCTLICNAAPNREGKFSPNIIARLKEIGELWKHTGPTRKVSASPLITTVNLATGKPILASASGDTYGPDLANDGNFANSWYVPHLRPGQTDGWLEVNFKSPTTFNTVSLVEPIGRFDDYQTTRIATYSFEAKIGSDWKPIASGTGGSAVQIHTIASTTATHLRLRLTPKSPTPHISEIGAYNEPPRRRS